MDNKLTKTKKRQLVGRDPTFGRTTFDNGCGVIKSKKSRQRNRKTKAAKSELNRQLNSN